MHCVVRRIAASSSRFAAALHWRSVRDCAAQMTQGGPDDRTRSANDLDGLLTRASATLGDHSVSLAETDAGNPIQHGRGALIHG
jgi:hypothetical protein